MISWCIPVFGHVGSPTDCSWRHNGTKEWYLSQGGQPCLAAVHSLLAIDDDALFCN